MVGGRKERKFVRYEGGREGGWEGGKVRGCYRFNFNLLSFVN